MVRFEITGFDWGSRRCSRNVIARNAEFEEFSMCEDYLRDGLRPEVGRSIEIRGMRSNWGIIRTQIEVVR